MTKGIEVQCWAFVLFVSFLIVKYKQDEMTAMLINFAMIGGDSSEIQRSEREYKRLNKCMDLISALITGRFRLTGFLSLSGRRIGADKEVLYQ